MYFPSEICKSGSSFTMSFYFQTEPWWKYTVFMGGEDTRSSDRKGTVFRSRYFRKYLGFSFSFLLHCEVRFHASYLMPTFELDLNIRKQSPVSWLVVLQWWCPFLKSSREKKVGVACELEQGSQFSQEWSYLYERTVLPTGAYANELFIPVINFWCWVHRWRIGIQEKINFSGICRQITKYSIILLFRPSIHFTVLGWEVHHQ